MKNLYLAIGALFLFTFSFGQTNVSGGIYNNTTWTAAGSPYIVVDTIVVFPGVVLTIDPGVTVKFENGKYMEIRQSSLIAVGTAADSITITSNSAAPGIGIYDGIHFNNPAGMAFDYCNFKYAEMPIQYCCLTIPNIFIQHSYFYKNANCIGVNNSIITITDSKFEYNTACILYSGSLITVHRSQFNNNVNCFGDYHNEEVTRLELDSCTFIQNTIAAHLDMYCRITNCTFSDNMYGVKMDNTGGAFTRTIKDCIFCNNQWGVLSEYSFNNTYDSLINCIFSNNGLATTFQVVYMTNNIFSDNMIALGMTMRPTDSIFNNYVFHNHTGLEYRGGASSNFFFNNYICNNNPYNIDYITSLNGTIPPMCYCESDSLAIRAKIYDGYVDITRGLLDFTPFVSCDSSAITALPPVICPSIPLAIEEAIPISKTGLEIFPNPSSGSFTIAAPFQNEKSPLEIFNLTGEVVYATSFIGRQVEITIKLPAGIYFVKVNASRNSFIGKLIIE